jgi:hypothetical protein
MGRSFTPSDVNSLMPANLVGRLGVGASSGDDTLGPPGTSSLVVANSLSVRLTDMGITHNGLTHGKNRPIFDLAPDGLWRQTVSVASPTACSGGSMDVLAEMDVKKDARNRITLPATAGFEHYHVKAFEDGHIELYPRVLADPLISMRTLDMMDAAMTNLASGVVGGTVDPDAMLNALNEE